jgi:hypothetical protein
LPQSDQIGIDAEQHAASGVFVSHQFHVMQGVAVSSR